MCESFDSVIHLLQIATEEMIRNFYEKCLSNVMIALIGSHQNSQYWGLAK